MNIDLQYMIQHLFWEKLISIQQSISFSKINEFPNHSYRYLIEWLIFSMSFENEHRSSSEFEKGPQILDQQHGHVPFWDREYPHHIFSIARVIWSLYAQLFFPLGNYLNGRKLMDPVNGSEYVPTYEDKDGDWMLVGDVPWKWV